MPLMDVDAVVLLARTDCPHCDDGMVMSDDWVAFQEWRSRRSSISPEAEDDLVEHYFLVVCDYSAVPAMSTACTQCEQGRLSVEVPLREVLAVVFEQVDQPLLDPGEIDELVDRVKKAMTHAALNSEGLMDGLEAGTWLRAVQEGAEALRSLGELRARRNGGLS